MELNIERYKKIIITIIEKYVPEAKIILYGSRARGDDQEGSDIDIAIDAGSKIDRHLVRSILHDLEDSDLPIFFDIVDFYDISENMQKEILKDGVIWKD